MLMAIELSRGEHQPVAFFRPPRHDRQVFACRLTVAAAEAAIGLAILVIFFRRKGSIAVDAADRMRG